jgi:hypothetical protein
VTRSLYGESGITAVRWEERPRGVEAIHGPGIALSTAMKRTWKLFGVFGFVALLAACGGSDTEVESDPGDPGPSNSGGGAVTRPSGGADAGAPRPPTADASSTVTAAPFECGKMQTPSAVPEAKVTFLVGDQKAFEPKGGEADGIWRAESMEVYLPNGSGLFVDAANSTGKGQVWFVFRKGEYQLHIDASLKLKTLTGEIPEDMKFDDTGTFTITGSEITMKSKCVSDAEGLPSIKFTTTGTDAKLLLRLASATGSVDIVTSAKRSPS